MGMTYLQQLLSNRRWHYNKKCIKDCKSPFIPPLENWEIKIKNFLTPIFF